MPRAPIPVRERFEAKVDRSGGPDACHLWTAAVFKQTGYGVFHPAKGETTTAHRWIYIAEHSDPGPRVFVDHECHNIDPECPGGRACYHRPCVNLRHLDGKSTGDNLNASPHANMHKIQCPAGHAYTPENTRLRPNSVGRGWSRNCRECERDRDRERAPRRRASKETTGVRI